MSHIAIYFTAYRLASGYSEDGEHGGPKGTTHTAIDDLESFSVLEIIRSRGQLSPVEITWANTKESQSRKMVGRCRAHQVTWVVVMITTGSAWALQLSLWSTRKSGDRRLWIIHVV